MDLSSTLRILQYASYGPKCFACKQTKWYDSHDNDSMGVISKIKKMQGQNGVQV